MLGDFAAFLERCAGTGCPPVGSVNPRALRRRRQSPAVEIRARLPRARARCGVRDAGAPAGTGAEPVAHDLQVGHCEPLVVVAFREEPTTTSVLGGRGRRCRGLDRRVLVPFVPLRDHDHPPLWRSATSQSAGTRAKCLTGREGRPGRRATAIPRCWRSPPGTRAARASHRPSRQRGTSPSSPAAPAPARRGRTG